MREGFNEEPGIYCTIRELPAEDWPAYVHLDMTTGIKICALDPRASRFEVILTLTDRLSTAEQNAVRAAYGQPPVDQQMDDRFCNDEPIFLYVAPSLRLPDEPALQGGAELLRRLSLGLLDQEVAMWEAEVGAVAVMTGLAGLRARLPAIRQQAS
jgi:hypothetical protein